MLKTVGNDISRVGINPYFIDEYKRVSERFSVKQISQALEYVMKADLKSKGIGGYNKKDETVLEETTFYVTEGGYVAELNYEIDPGDNYGLRCITEEPLLWREGTDTELSYPYELGGLATITNSTAGPQFSYYYFFYD